jgi:hypothetical protein
MTSGARRTAAGGHRVFQQYLAEGGSTTDEDEQGDEDGGDKPQQEQLQNRLFELANAPVVSYRTRGGGSVTIRQDRDARVHTGGIVWETSYLLATALEHSPGALRRPGATGPGAAAATVLEVGAGCGLLGMVLARAGCDVTLSEHPLAMPNLRHNVASNQLATGDGGGGAGGGCVALADLAL